MAAHGRRETKKRETRQRLAECGMGLFLERGFDAVKVEEIASEAGVSTRTVFRYFATKEDLAFATWKDDLEALCGLVRERGAHPGSPERIQMALLDFARWMKSEEEALRRTLELRQTSSALQERAAALRPTWVNALADEMARVGGRDHPEDQDLLTAELMVPLLSLALQRWLATGAELEEEVRRLWGTATTLFSA